MTLETVLVPYDGSAEADDMLHFACDAVVGRRRVIALYVIRVPSSLPLDPLPSWFDQEGNQALDHAEALAWYHGVMLETALTRARHRAEAIVGEARAEAVDAIIVPVGTGWRLWRHLLLSRTVRAVMRQAPCPVLLGRRGSLVYERAWPMTSLTGQAASPYPPAIQNPQ